jgi:2-polyprenyl-3-methyl-5-hydroxy-6-metoxy-1,4-benzoquinol methylase
VQIEEHIEEHIRDQFAGQSLLRLDPRTEESARPCPACEETATHAVGIKNELPIVCCRGCDTYYTPYSPWYTSECFYGNFYAPGEFSEPEFVHQRAAEITAKFSAYRQTNRLLDIGCGAGTLLRAARAHGWLAHGVEVSETSVARVRDLGFEVFHGEVQEAGYLREHFDVITAAELLEHLFDPAIVVNEAAQLLRKGGLFWTTTPHGRGISARLLGLKWSLISPPEHLQLFSVAGLKILLQRAGFRDITIRTEGTNPSEILNAVRSKPKLTTSAEENHDRVRASHKLNQALTKTRYRQRVKQVLNGCLNLTRMGDSLKVFARR